MSAAARASMIGHDRQVSTRRRNLNPYPFHVMLKPRGPVCNLACTYCYYLPKEHLYPGSDFRMDVEVLETLTRQYMEAQPAGEVTFGWQGGEPLLMGLDFFRRAVELQERYRRPGVQVVNALQTNGTLLDDAWCRFLLEKNFLVGLSLDGPRELHDAYRRDKAGMGSFDRVIEGLRLLKKHNVDFNILACVHAANADHPLAVYRFLRDEVATSFIQLIPIVQRDEGGCREVTDRSVTGRQYGAFLIGVFDEWVRRDVGKIFVQIFDVALAAWLGLSPGLCMFSPTCGRALAMEHNGDVYACDHFVEPRYKLGNVLETSLLSLFRSRQQERFGSAKRDALPAACRRCKVRFACQGGCLKNRLLRTQDGGLGLNYLCEGYTAFFEHIDEPMRFMMRELQAGRPAANAMAHLATEEKP